MNLYFILFLIVIVDTDDARWMLDDRQSQGHKLPTGELKTVNTNLWKISGNKLFK